MPFDLHIDPSLVQISDLLPQKRPFLMIDKLSEYSTKRSVTEFLVKEDNPFVSDGLFREGGIIENVAQSCAAHNGWRDFLENRPVRLGAVGVVKNFDIYSLPAVGDHLITEIEVIEFVFDIILMRSVVHCSGKLSAEGEMKLSLL